MRIGILIAGHVPEEMIAKHGDYDSVFARLLKDDRLEFVSYNVVDGEFPKSLDEVDGWLVTGSKYGAYEGHDWIPPLEQLIRDIKAKGQPLIGVCFGHQVIAQALGGKVEKFNGGWVAGPNRYSRSDTGGSHNTLAWHQDQVVEKPAEAEVIGSSPTCENAVLRYGDKIITYQAHPEFTEEFIKDLMAARPGLLPEEVADNVASTQQSEVDRQMLAEEMKAHFLKGAASE